MEIKSAVLIPDKPGYMLVPDMPGVPAFENIVYTKYPKDFWYFGGRVHIVQVKPEFIEEVAKRYFKVPFLFHNPKTGNTTMIEDSLANIAHLIVKEWNKGRDWATIVGFEEV